MRREKSDNLYTRNRICSRCKGKKVVILIDLISIVSTVEVGGDRRGEVKSEISLRGNGEISLFRSDYPKKSREKDSPIARGDRGRSLKDSRGSFLPHRSSPVHTYRSRAKLHLARYHYGNNSGSPKRNFACSRIKRHVLLITTLIAPGVEVRIG